jgi:phosphohistidine phosphatase
MVFLVHHAQAVPAHLDPQQPLSQEGLAHADALARQAWARGARPEAIWHSGRLRARQTAGMFWRHCNPLASLTAVRGLQPADPPSWMADTLAVETRSVLLVGHMPNLPRLLGTLVRDEAAGFPPHGVVALERGEQGWIEAWRLTDSDVSS